MQPWVAVGLSAQLLRVAAVGGCSREQAQSGPSRPGMDPGRPYRPAQCSGPNGPVRTVTGRPFCPPRVIRVFFESQRGPPLHPGTSSLPRVTERPFSTSQSQTFRSAQNRREVLLFTRIVGRLPFPPRVTWGSQCPFHQSRRVVRVGHQTMILHFVEGCKVVIHS